MRIKWIENLISNIAIILICIYLPGQIFSLLRSRSRLFNVSTDEIENDINEYYKETNELTGWPTKKFVKTNLDPKGFRRYKRFPKNPCLEVFGGSYTYSFNAKQQEDSWSGIVGDILGCKVLNYGIPGFGIDQSFLRYKKFASTKNTSLLLFVDDSLDRSMFPMLGLSYDGLGKKYDGKYFKPLFMKSGRDLFLQEPNPEFVLEKAVDTRQTLCKGPTTSLCIIRKIAVKTLASIKSKGEIYQRIYSLSPKIAWYIEKRIPILQLNVKDKSINLNISILSKYLDHCRTNSQKCYIARFPLMLDVAYPERLKINYIELSMLENISSNHYIPSFALAKCMKKKLSKKNQALAMDRSVMRFQNRFNKHYLQGAEKAFAECISPYIVK